MAGERGKLALIVNAASYERVAFALSVAIAAAAAGQQVELLFGHAGLVRLKKGSTDQVGDETEVWLRDQIRSGLEKGSVSRISQLLQTVLKLGAEIYVCPAAMALHNLVRAELIEEVKEVCSLGEFMSRAAQGASVLYI